MWSALVVTVSADDAGRPALVYGTLVNQDGSFEHLDATAFSVDALGSWTSPKTGIRYPAGWRLVLPTAGLKIELHPTIDNQELDTRPTTGVVYWEGSQRVSAMKEGRPLAGEAYVELTGYAAP